MNAAPFQEDYVESEHRGSVKQEVCSDSAGSSEMDQACWDSDVKDELVWSPERVQKRVGGCDVAVRGEFMLGPESLDQRACSGDSVVVLSASHAGHDEYEIKDELVSSPERVQKRASRCDVAVRGELMLGPESLEQQACSSDSDADVEVLSSTHAGHEQEVKDELVSRPEFVQKQVSGCDVAVRGELMLSPESLQQRVSSKDSEVDVVSVEKELVPSPEHVYESDRAAALLGELRSERVQQACSGDREAELDSQAQHGREQHRKCLEDRNSYVYEATMLHAVKKDLVDSVRLEKPSCSGDGDGFSTAHDGLAPGSECEEHREVALLDALHAGHKVKDKFVFSPERVQKRASMRSKMDVFGVQRLPQGPQKLNDLTPAMAVPTPHLMLKTCCVKLERVDAGRPLAPGAFGASGRLRAPDWRPACSVTDTAYVCDSCGKTFKRKYLLIRHIHLGKHGHCQSRIDSFNNGKTKNETKDGVVEHLCETCGKQFTQKCHLIRHNRAHTGEKLYTCDICNAKFTRLETLRSHKWIHTGKKLYSCEICNKQFTRKRNLKLHKQIHDGEKPYTCEICKRQFTGPNNIDRHKRTHTGEVLYSCKICKKDFTRLSNLKEHEWIHSGQKPYSCDICKKRFTRLRTLKTHEQKFHGV